MPGMDEVAAPSPPPPLGKRAIDLRRPAVALCFAGGHLDVLSISALACVDADTHQVLTPWLRKQRAVHIRATESLPRLYAAAEVVSALPHLAELFVGGRRLEVRWLKGSDASASTRNVLEQS